MPRDAEPPAQSGPQSDSQAIAPAQYTAPRPAAAPPPPRRPLRVPGPALLAAAGAGVFALALLGWFFATARSVTLQVEPPEAELSVAGGFAPGFGGRYRLRPGRYAVQMRAEGYAAREESFEVGEAPRQQFRFALAKLPGRLRIAGAPSAELWIAGESRGETPLEVELPAGRHRLRLNAPRHLPWEQEIEVEGFGRLQELRPELEPAWANAALASEPPGAKIFAADELLGETPGTFELLQGRHQLRFELAGYAPQLRSVIVQAGVDPPPLSVKLSPAGGTLSLRSTPSGAIIQVNGAFRGRTPAELGVPPNRNLRVVLSKEGFGQAQRSVRVVSGGRSALHLDLVAKTGEVWIRALPADSELRVDGKLVGRGEVQLMLSATPHQLEVSRPGYATRTQRFTPRPGLPSVVEVRLKTSEQAALDALPREIATPLGQKLRLIMPGALQMGSSRREPGRLANEPLRQVTLSRPFYLARREVSNAEFRRFAPQHNSGQHGALQLSSDELPAVRVSWVQAALFCNWLSAQHGLAPFYVARGGAVVGSTPGAKGYRLPSEAEWAWAARKPGASPRYPWGDALPPPARAGNYADQSAAAALRVVLPNYNDGFAGPAPVGSFAGPRGLFDLAGNAAEWMHDFYEPNPGDARDPLGPAQGTHHVIRGASWMQGARTELRLAYRDYGSEARADLGFRIARSP